MEALTIVSPVAKYRHPRNEDFIATLASCGAFDVRLAEVYGFSEVARARCMAATKAYPIVKERGGLVLWLDADMETRLQGNVLHDRNTFRFNHRGCLYEGHNGYCVRYGL